MIFLAVSVLLPLCYGRCMAKVQSWHAFSASTLQESVTHKLVSELQLLCLAQEDSAQGG